jgi:hypothetical protein
MYCQGTLGKDGKPHFKFWGLCEDPKVAVMEEELNYLEVNSIFKLQIKKDVLPP